MQKRTHTLLSIIAISVLLVGCQLRPIQPVSPQAPSTLPFAWPMPALTAEQLEEVRQCDLETLPLERYPETLDAEELRASYEPKNVCDWAILATAHAYRSIVGAPLSPAAQEAFTTVVLKNPGFMFTTPFFYGYFVAPPIVGSPDFAMQEITDVSIDYSWVGLGSEPLTYTVEIQQANTEPIVISEQLTETVTIDKSAVQTFTTALGNFMPVDTKFALLACSDNYPAWVVNLTFADGREVEVTTESNFMYIGGPWFMELDEQVYVQLSPAFGAAVGTLINSLGLTLGQPAALTCFPQPVLDLAFP